MTGTVCSGGPCNRGINGRSDPTLSYLKPLNLLAPQKCGHEPSEGLSCRIAGLRANSCGDQHLRSTEKSSALESTVCPRPFLSSALAYVAFAHVGTKTD